MPQAMRRILCRELFLMSGLRGFGLDDSYTDRRVAVLILVQDNRIVDGGRGRL